MLDNFSLIEAIRIGGTVMYFLIACSVLSIAIIVERLLYYRGRAKVSRIELMRAVRQNLMSGDVDGAIGICKDSPSPYSAVVVAGLTASKLDAKQIADAMEREIIVETNSLEERTAIVGTIGSTAVYVGLLGTVWGIIKTFRDISSVGSGGINVVIGGISEALVCTAAGLLVAIPAVMAYNYFVKRVSLFITDMELSASELRSIADASILKGAR
jgi:biopolymer transport protein ExbB/TolQ